MRVRDVIKMTRQQIFDAIIAERAAQDRDHGGPEHNDTLGPHHWAAILVRHLGLAFSDAGEFDAVRYKRQLIRTAAICVAALESLGRKPYGMEADMSEHRPGY